MIAPSQGIHLVLDRDFLSGETAIMVPHTSDGRVLFAIPWHKHTIVGTTDTPIDAPSYEPLPFEHEIAFILETASEYLSRPPRREDVLSVYVGIRPLVKAAGSDTGNTSAISRDHTIHIDDSGLLTIAGGKWTTYRRMAQDAVDHAITLGRLEDKPCVTQDLRLHGYADNTEKDDPLAVYGSDGEKIRRLAAESPELSRALDPELPPIAAEVVWAVREEMARSVEDILARRTRALFLRARAALRMAPAVAALMARELGQDSAWIDRQLEDFRQLAAQYTLDRTAGTSPETTSEMLAFRKGPSS